MQNWRTGQSSRAHTATERKSSRRSNNVQDHDYQLQKEYLQKLRTQRTKAQRLLQQHQQLLSNLKTSQGQRSRLQLQVEALREELRRKEESYGIQIGQLKIALQQYQTKQTLIGREKMGERSLRVRDAEAELAGLRVEKELLEEKVQELQELWQQQRQKNHELQLQIKGKLVNTHRQIQNANSVQHGVVIQLQHDKTHLQQQLKLLQEERDQLHRDLHSKTLEILAIKAEQQGQLKQRDRKVAAMQAEYSRAKAFWESKDADQHKETDFFRVQYRNMQITLKVTQDKYSETSKQLNECRKNRDDLAQQVERLKSVVKIVEAEYGRACKQLVSFKNINEQLNQQHLILKQQIHELKLQVDDYEVKLERKKLYELERHQLLEEEFEQMQRFQGIWDKGDLTK